jgi:hypothetical protein
MSITGEQLIGSPLGISLNNMSKRDANYTSTKVSPIPRYNQGQFTTFRPILRKIVQYKIFLKGFILLLSTDRNSE